MTDPATLSVRGEASLDVLADHALISVQVVREDTERELALASADAAATAVRDVVGSANGLRRSTIYSARVTEVREWEEPRKTSVRVRWRASLGGTADVDAAHAGRLAGALVAAGAELLGITWRVDETNPAHREVRRLAVADARRAADDFAHALGGSTGRLLQIADPGLISGTDAIAVSTRGGAYAMSVNDELEIDPQVVSIRAVVEARYLLDDA
jgi:uncharacterized protein YggE